MASNSEICFKCKCKCILVSLEDIYCNSNLTAASKLLTDKAHVFNKVHDFILRPLLGECLINICNNKFAAIERAKEEGGHWEDYASEDYLQILKDGDFIGMYSNYVEFYAACASGVNYEYEGMKEYDRTLEGGVGVSRNIDAKNKSLIKADLLRDAQKYKEMFIEKLEQFSLDCLPNKNSCTPSIQDYKPRSLHFAKSDRT